MIIDKSVIFSYKNKLVYIFIGTVIGIISFIYTGYIVKQLDNKEINEVKLWSHAMTIASSLGTHSEISNNYELNKLTGEIIRNNTIPCIITDSNLLPVKWINIPGSTTDNPELLKKQLEKLAGQNNPIEVEVSGIGKFYIFYGRSKLLNMFKVFPYVQFAIVAIFILFVFISFRSSKADEQKRVWIGMAKETAHQLGTPTTSLLGWLEYLRAQNTDEFVIEEMNRDITRLLKVVNRFSKIGAETVLVPRNVYEIVGNAVQYFKTRIPKNVTLNYQESASVPIQAMVNEALFEWVIENLLKNALDALQGKGRIDVSIYQFDKWVNIDVKDSGKGINRSNFNKIFTPGFTTKTRGWGLGLSLSYRIIREYHNGKIFVADSEIDKGTIMRIQLHRL